MNRQVTTSPIYYSCEDRNGNKFRETKNVKVEGFFEDGETRIIPADFDKLSNCESTVHDNTFTDHCLTIDLIFGSRFSAS